MGRLVMPPPSGGLNLVDPPSKMRDDQCQQADNVLSVPQGLEVFAGFLTDTILPPRAGTAMLYTHMYSRVGEASVPVVVWGNSAGGRAWYKPAVHQGTGLQVHITAAGGAITAIDATPHAGGTGYRVDDVVSITQGTASGGGARVTAIDAPATGVVTALDTAPVGTGAGYVTEAAVGLGTVGVWRTISDTSDTGIDASTWPVYASFLHYNDSLYFTARDSTAISGRPHKFSYDTTNGYTFSPVGRLPYEMWDARGPRVRPVAIAQVSTGTDATVSFSVASGGIDVVTAAPAAAGSGYKPGDVVIVSGGTGGLVRVDTVNDLGGVTAWLAAPVLAGSGYGASPVVGAATTSGLLSKFTVESAGSGYTINPTVELDGGGTGVGFAAATPVPRMKLQVGEVYTVGSGIYASGTGYTPGTYVVDVIPPGTSSWVTAPLVSVVVGAGGSVTSATVLTSGSGWEGLSYKSSTNLGVGSGFTFTPHMQLDDVVMTTPTLTTAAAYGTGYTEVPIASFFMRTGFAGVCPEIMGAGPLNGRYVYAFTYQWVDSDGLITYETGLSDVVYSPTLTNDSVAIRLYNGRPMVGGTYDGITDFGISPTPSYLAVYRKSTTQSYFYFVGRVAYANLPSTSMIALTYTDALSDNDVGVIAPTGHGIPPPCKFLVTWKRRMWYINTSNGEGEILYSALDSPEYTAVDPNPLYPNSAGSFLTDEGLDAEITGAAAVRDGLVVFTRMAQYIIQGNDASDFRMSRVGTDGCVSVGSAISFKDAVFWYAPTGFLMWDTSNGTTRIGDSLGTFTLPGAGRCFLPAATWKDYYLCADPAADYGATPVVFYAFSTKTGGWTKLSFTPLVRGLFTDIGDPTKLYEIVYQGDSAPFTTTFIGTYSTSAAGLAVTVKRKLLDMGDPAKYKVVTTLSQEFQQTAQQSFNLILYGQASALSTTAITTEAGAGAAKYAVTHLRAGAREVAPGLTMTAGVPQTTIGRTIVEYAERGVARV